MKARQALTTGVKDGHWNVHSYLNACYTQECKTGTDNTGMKRWTWSCNVGSDLNACCEHQHEDKTGTDKSGVSVNLEEQKNKSPSCYCNQESNLSQGILQSSWLASQPQATSHSEEVRNLIWTYAWQTAGWVLCGWLEHKSVPMFAAKLLNTQQKCRSWICSCHWQMILFCSSPELSQSLLICPTIVLHMILQQNTHFFWQWGGGRGSPLVS